MTFIRAIVATILFFVKFFITSFEWMNLTIGVVCFTFAYFIWPSKKQNQRHEDSWPLDGMEIFVEVPVKIIFWIFRMIGRLFHKADDIDF